MNNQLKQIEEIAYRKYLLRGCEHGHDQQDWYEAEAEINKPSQKNAGKKTSSRKKKA